MDYLILIQINDRMTGETARFLADSQSLDNNHQLSL